MRRLFVLALVMAATGIGLIPDRGLDAQTRAERRRERPPEQNRPAVYYRNCDEARAAGAAPILRGQPGYRPPLDRDNDGIACEPYRGRR